MQKDAAATFIQHRLNLLLIEKNQQEVAFPLINSSGLSTFFNKAQANDSATFVAVRNSSAGSELEVVQFATDRSGRILATDNSGGRFLVQVDTFSDPAIYQGRLVSLVGKVAGQKRARLDEIEYLYPVLTAHELHYWRPVESPDASRVHFGFGLGVGTVIH